VAAARYRPWVVCLAGYVIFFGALFGPVWARGSSLAVGDAMVQSGPACYGPRGLWTTALFLGYPLAADPTQLRFYPLSALCPLPGALEVLVATPFLIAAFGMTGFVRSLTGSWTAAIVAGLAFALGGFENGHAGHIMISTPGAWSPYVLWAFETMRRSPAHRFAFAGAAVATALCILSGQPNTPLFALTLAVAYALLCAPAAEGGAGRYLRTCGIAFALGIGLSGIQLAPEFELWLNATRRAISYEFFTGDQLSPLQLLVRLAFPYLLGGSGGSLYPLSSGALGSFTEMANSSGLALVLVAAVGALAPGGPRRWFWAGVAVLGWALSLGSTLGLSYVTYHLPLYSLFREPGRHAFESGFALAVLAGFGIAALERRTVTVRAAALAVCGTAALGTVAWLLFALGGANGAPGLSALDELALPDHLNPLRNPALALPLVTWLCAAAALFVAVRRPATRGPRLALVAAFAASALAFAEGGYWNWAAPSRSEFARPALAAGVADVLGPAHHRLIVRPGADESLAANMTQLWGVPLVTGYLSLVPSHLQRLLDLTPEGATGPDVFAPENAAVLDLVGAGLFAIDPADVREERSSTDPFGTADLSVFLGGRGAAPIQSVRFAVAPAFAGTRLALLDALGFAAEIPQGATVAEAVVTGADGRRLTFPLRAGIESAEAAYDRSDVRSRMRHRPAATASSDGTFRRYLTSLPLPPHFLTAQIEVRRTYPDPQNGAFSLYGVALVDDHLGSALALGAMSYLSSDPGHWRERTIDGHLYYENLGALPKVWIPREVRPADDASALAAMRALRDGRATYDARALAFVDDPVGRVRGARGSVTIERLDETALTLHADCATECVVADDDLWYPGWEARVDGVRTPLLRLDVALRGIRVAPGSHRIELRYAPLSVTLGLIVSLLAALALAAYLAVGSARGRERFAYDA